MAKPFHWITGDSFTELRRQMLNATGPDARLEVHEDEHAMTFLVVDPDADADIAGVNEPVDDTFTCPPICPKR